jgi:hypothetical protein
VGVGIPAEQRGELVAGDASVSIEVEHVELSLEAFDLLGGKRWVGHRGVLG